MWSPNRVCEAQSLGLPSSQLGILSERLFFKGSRFFLCFQFSSIQFNCSVVSDSLQLHESRHGRPPCPSSTPGVHPNSCALSQWCHPAIASSAVPFSTRLQSFSGSGSFPMSQLFAWGGQSIGVSALSSVLPVNTQDWSPLGGTGWISLLYIATIFSCNENFQDILS